MNQSTEKTKTFTIGQATQMLPLVSSIATEAVDLVKQVRQTRQRLHEVLQIRLAPDDDQNIYSSELLSIEDHVQQQEQRIGECVSELTDLGVKVRLQREGFVDFPATREGSPIYLCWQLGDKEVEHWHTADQDCSQRKKVDLALIRQVGEYAVL